MLIITEVIDVNEMSHQPGVNHSLEDFAYGISQADGSIVFRIIPCFVWFRDHDYFSFLEMGWEIAQCHSCVVNVG